MQSICESLEQRELLRFWISELTGSTPQQAEAVILMMKERKKQNRVA